MGCQLSQVVVATRLVIADAGPSLGVPNMVADVSLMSISYHAACEVLPRKASLLPFVFEKWCARQESNLLPCGPEF